jgi:hypothetical protein
MPLEFAFRRARLKSRAKLVSRGAQDNACDIVKGARDTWAKLKELIRISGFHSDQRRASSIRPAVASEAV